MKPSSRETAERAILDRFIQAYSKRFSIELTNITHQDKPDFVVVNSVTGEILGIEVTGAYQNAQEAKIQYGVEKLDRFVSSSDEIISSLNARLSDKAEKSKAYVFDSRMILVIWLGSLVFNQKTDIDRFLHKLVIPNSKFSEIWLVVRDKDDYSPDLYLLQG